MLGEIVVSLIIAFTVFYCICGTILSIKLADELDYQGGFLVLWNKMQFSLVASNTQLPEFKSERAIKLKARLFKLIKLSYIVIIGGCFLVFFSDLPAKF